MMKSKWVQQLLKILIALLGAGLGVALTMGAVQLHTWTQPGKAIDGGWLVGMYAGTAAIGALIFYLFSDLLIRKCYEWAAAMEAHIDGLTTVQMVFGLAGLVGGLLIAALSSQILHFLGDSIFTTASSAILYVLLGTTGLSIGKRRSEDLAAMLWKLPGLRERKGAKKSSARPKLLDAAVLCDGRILAVCRTGFMEGEMIVPAFVLAELRRMQDSPDSLRRSRGRRGLETLERLQAEKSVALRVDPTDYEDVTECDVKLLRLAQQLSAAVMTADGALQKLAGVAGVPVLNLNDLAGALRPVVQAGEEMNVTILKEGKEPGQGVGYLPDGTMIVVEGGRAHLGKDAAVIVTSALQTSAGRMVFAKVKEA